MCKMDTNPKRSINVFNDFKFFCFAPLCQAALRGPYHVPFFEGWCFGWSFDHFSLNYLFFRKIIWVIVLGFCSDIIISSILLRLENLKRICSYLPTKTKDVIIQTIRMAIRTNNYDWFRNLPKSQNIIFWPS